MTGVTPPAARVSHEQRAVQSLRDALAGVPGIELFSGQGGANRFDVPGWELPLLQQFLYGDLRVETASTTVIVELESAGGVGNLVKFWPLLTSGTLRKRFILLHVFQVVSEFDYFTHRRLWDFLIERMREDLGQRGVPYPAAWEAHRCTYRPGEGATEAAAFLRTVCAQAALQRP